MRTPDEPVIEQHSPPDSAALDNPVWASLEGPHRSLAGCLPDLLWYPSSIAPFAAIPGAHVLPDLDSARDLGLGEQVYFVGACPATLPAGWRFAAHSNILQLFPTGAIPAAEEDAGILGFEGAEATIGWSVWIIRRGPGEIPGVETGFLQPMFETRQTLDREGDMYVVVRDR